MPFDEITEKFSGSTGINASNYRKPEIFSNPSCHFFIKWLLVHDLRKHFSANFSFYKLKPRNMKRETLEKLMLPELCNLLVDNTLLLLESMDKKADGATIRDLRKNVELIQEIITKKRMEEAA